MRRSSPFHHLHRAAHSPSHVEREPELEQLRRLVGQGPAPALPLALATLSDRHLAAVAAAGASAATLKAYRSIERRYIQYVGSAGTLDVTSARDWLRSLDHLAPISRRSYGIVLKVWSGFLESDGLLAENPLRKLKNPKASPPVIQLFTPDQVRAIVQAAHAGRWPERDVAVVYLLLDSLIRASELAGLERADLSGRWLTVRHAKGGKQRRLCLEPATVARLTAYLAARPDAAAPLFLAPGGARWTAPGLAARLRLLGRAAGVVGPRNSPHDYRHTGAVRYLQAHPGHLAQLQRRLGHETLAMTLRYAGRAADEVVLDGSALELSGL